MEKGTSRKRCAKDLIAGTRVRVLWDAGEWFSGVIKSYSSRRGSCVLYDDGETKYHDLDCEEWETERACEFNTPTQQVCLVAHQSKTATRACCPEVADSSAERSIQPALGKDAVGLRVTVKFDDGHWYPGRIDGYAEGNKDAHHVYYDDGDGGWVTLTDQDVHLITDSDKSVHPECCKVDRPIAGSSSRFLPFEQARTYMRQVKLKSSAAFNEWKQAGKRPRYIPADPRRTYAGRWCGWRDWLGTQSDLPFLTFAEARSFAHGLELSGPSAWRAWARSGKRPANVPSNPDAFYAKTKQFQGWPDWLGYDPVQNQKAKVAARRAKQFLPFCQARAFVHSLEGVKTRRQWRDWSKNGHRPQNIPRNPDHVYKTTGWRNWRDWFGKCTLPDLTFEEAREYARKLKFLSSPQWHAWSRSGLLSSKQGRF